MAGRHSQTKLTVASICSGYDEAYALIQGNCAKFAAYCLCFLCTAVVRMLIHSAAADTYIGAKLPNTFEGNSMDKGKTKEKKSSNISSFLGASFRECLQS